MSAGFRPGIRQRKRGQALVEFALIFPVAIVMLLAVFDVGRAVFMYNSLTNAAREGARLAIVNQDKTLIGQRVQDQAAAAGISNLGDLDDLISFRKQLPNDDPLANDVCSPLTVGCVAVVTARADWNAITPVIGQLIGAIELEARSELPIEFECPNPPAYATSASCPKQP
jgi:Flp pilus assembly protein TadG